MPFWPFKRSQPEPKNPVEIRTQLIQAAASGSPSRLREFCSKFKDQIAANVEFMCKAPDGMATDPASIDAYVQCLGAAAQCLAQECKSPELWNQLCGSAETNPLAKWDAWYAEFPRRREQLEHEALIAEARAFIAEARSLQGRAARQNEAFLFGRLGELLFHSGRVADSIEPFSAALSLCREINDVEGQRIYLNNLLEAKRYLGDVDDAIRLGREAIELSQSNGLDCGELRKQVGRLEQGEPPCRVVLVRDGKEVELGDFSAEVEGRYEFEFRRNRLSLQVAIVLSRQGNELASSGQLADALTKFQVAMEVDPHDPDPVYQSGMCLLELGAYGKAKEAFDEVERLAPSWFQCRFHSWLAESLEAGSVTEDEFQILRVLDNSNLPPNDAESLARRAIEVHSDFAPLYLTLGDICQRQDNGQEAIVYYRRGLELVAEPDLESRLLCALAGALPKGSKERPELVKRAISLDGNLVAQAMAAFIPV